MGFIVGLGMGGVGRGPFAWCNLNWEQCSDLSFCPSPPPPLFFLGGGGGQIYTTLASSNLVVMGLVASAVLADRWATMGQV